MNNHDTAFTLVGNRSWNRRILLKPNLNTSAHQTAILNQQKKPRFEPDINLASLTYILQRSHSKPRKTLLAVNPFTSNPTRPAQNVLPLPAAASPPLISHPVLIPPKHPPDASFVDVSAVGQAAA